MEQYYLAIDIGASSGRHIWKTEKWYWKKYIVFRME